MKSVVSAICYFCVLASCLGGCDDRSVPVGNQAGSAPAVSQEAQAPIFTFDGECQISSVPIPTGFESSTAGHARCTVWLAPKGRRDSGMVVCLFALGHDTVKAAQQGRDGFQDFAAGERTWRVAMPDPEDDSDDSFMAILILSDVAVAAYGSDFGWNENDLRTFLAGVRLAAQ